MQSMSENVIALAKQLQAWQNGIQFERDFWEQFFVTRGLQWPDDFASRLRPDTEIGALLGDFAGNYTPRVLDVGSGPMTSLGKYHHGKPIKLIACDPLAPFYTDMASRHSIERPIVTEQAFAEELTSFYDVDSFDVVHCSNALDHSFDPVCGIEEMLLVVKPGCRVVLEHFVNEAEFGTYIGFHQWNFDEEAGDFIIWNKNCRINATQLFTHWAEITTTKVDRWISVAFVKRTTAPRTDITARTRQRVRDLMAAMLLAATTLI